LEAACCCAIEDDVSVVEPEIGVDEVGELGAEVMIVGLRIGERD